MLIEANGNPLTIVERAQTLVHELAIAEARGQTGTEFRPAENFDWPALRDLLRQAKMLVTLFDRVEGLMPPAERALARRDYEQLLARSRGLLREMDQLQKRARDRGLNLLFVKGAPFSQQHYGNPYRRLSMDVDMLVERHAVSQMDQVLRELGYKVPLNRYLHPPVPAEEPEQYCPVAVDYPAVGNIYHMLRPDYVRFENDVKYSAEIKYFIRYVENRNLYRLFTDSVWCPVGEIAVRTLAIEHSVIHFALDKYKDFVRGAQFRYRDLFDLVILTTVHGDAAFWDRVHTKAVDLGVAEPVFDTLAVPLYVLATPPRSERLRELIDASASTRLFDYLRGEDLFSATEISRRFNERFAPSFVRCQLARSAGAVTSLPIVGRIELPNGAGVPCFYRFQLEAQRFVLTITLARGGWDFLGHLMLHLTLFGSSGAGACAIVVEYDHGRPSIVSNDPAGTTAVQAGTDGDMDSLTISTADAVLPVVRVGTHHYLLYSLRIDRAWYNTPNGRSVFALIAGHDRQILRLD